MIAVFAAHPSAAVERESKPTWRLATNGTGDPSGTPRCEKSLHTFDEALHKQTYRVAVDTVDGVDEAFERYEKLFSEYLSQTAGERFDQPIAFEMVSLDYSDLFEAAENEQIDFIYADPGVYSCIGVEFGAEALVTTTSHLAVRGYDYDLDLYGGVIFAKADNDSIEKIEDLKDMIIGAGSLSMLMGGQLQFYSMMEAGLSYTMDPKQVVFTENQQDVVKGVMEGDFDVGFVGTSKIELHHDANGEPIDPDIFKIISPKVHTLENGKLFPFLHSTEIYPEYPFAALSHVNVDVSLEVQEALLALQDHSLADEVFRASAEWDPDRCDTSMDIAELASQVRGVSHIAGFRPSRSYFQVDSMHRTAGFMQQDDRGKWKCDHSDNLYDQIKCPEGYYKLPYEEYQGTCDTVGLGCGIGFECYCRPCLKAFQVDVFECSHPDDYIHEDRHIGCGKMSVCLTLMQTKEKVIRIRDNLQRDNAEVTVVVHQGPETYQERVIKVDDYRYKIRFSSQVVGVAVMEVFVNGEQIPESPFRVQIDDLDCEIDYPGDRKTSNAQGQCVCKSSTMELFGKCIETTVVAVSISAVAIILVTILGTIYVRYRTHKNDEMWMVSRLLQVKHGHCRCASADSI